jgi:tellurite resistance protein TerC
MLLFTSAILLIIAFDLKKHRQNFSLKDSIRESILWVVLALAFNVFIYFTQGQAPAFNFLSTYLLEKALSIDNLFIFHTLFQMFNLTISEQHRCLIWGVLGAFFFRAVLILVGVSMLESFSSISYILGAFLAYTAYQMAIHPPSSEVKDFALLNFLKRKLPVTEEKAEGQFLVKEKGSWKVTPLLLCLILVEATDILFAIDSIPAALAISKDPFIIYTANVFAILGLRSLYFVVSQAVQSFYYLHHTLSFILAFIAVKLLIAQIYHIPPSITLGIIATSFTIGIIASIRHKKESS